MRITGFIVYEKYTGERLITLPLTFPVGEIIEGYERAGYTVAWRWEISEGVGA
jgi:hypothetical protein